MTNLSPAAQAVLDAHRAADRIPQNGVALGSARLAAALRAAADQVVPEEPLYVGDQRWMFERDSWRASRKKLLAIAAELKAYAQ
jgi:hypothetical protein